MVRGSNSRSRVTVGRLYVERRSARSCRIRSGDVAVQLANCIVLRADYPVHQVADGDDADDAVGIENWKISDLARGHHIHALANGLLWPTNNTGAVMISRTSVSRDCLALRMTFRA